MAIGAQSPLVKTTLFTAIGLIILIGSIQFYHHFSFDHIQTLAINTQAFVTVYPTRSLLLFAVFYCCICAFPMPFISVFTMVAGYFFGNIMGLLVVSFMSALGGSILFIMVRYLFRDWVQQWLAQRQSHHYLQQAAQTDSFSVALSIRFIPAMPFPIPAISLALSQLSLWKFYLSTQLGLFITLFVYVNAGRSLTQVDSLQAILSPTIIASMLALAILPLLFKYMNTGYSHNKA